MSRVLNLGGGGGGVIAGSETVYTSTPADITGLAGDNAFANRLTGIDSGEALNDGEFTVTTVSSVDRIVIPEDGNYQITCASRVNLTNNNTLSTARGRFTSRIRRARSGSPDLTLGSGGDVYVRHQYLGTFASGSTEAEAVVSLQEDDEIWFDYATNQQTNSTTADIETEIYIYRLAAAGPRGSKGTTGDTGDDGDDGAQGIQGIQGEQGIQGIQGVPGQDGSGGGASLPTDEQGAGRVLQIPEDETLASAAEWVDADLSSTGTADTLTIESSTGTDVTLVGADPAGDAGLMTRADKGFLNLTVLDPNQWIRNLAGGDHSAEGVANTFDTYIPNRLQEFQLGGDYVENEIAYYHRVLYLALTTITGASTVPSQDPTNWREFSTHRLEGYGDIAVSLNASVQLASIDIAAQDASLTPSFHTVTPTVTNNFPQTLIALNSNSLIEAQADTVSATFDRDHDLGVIGRSTNRGW